MHEKQAFDGFFFADFSLSKARVRAYVKTGKHARFMWPWRLLLTQPAFGVGRFHASFKDVLFYGAHACCLSASWKSIRNTWCCFWKYFINSKSHTWKSFGELTPSTLDGIQIRCRNTLWTRLSVSFWGDNANNACFSKTARTSFLSDKEPNFNNPLL